MSNTEQQNGSGGGGEEKKGESSGRQVTMEELGQHGSQGDLWLLVDGKVYDVTKFMDEHPGGDEVLTAEAGKDATEAFEDVGHSDDARSLLPGMLVGSIEGGVEKAKKTASSANQTIQKNGNPALMFIPLALLGAWFAYKHMQQ
ncbi:cytochrome b5 [Jaminaea rosea]|uniref:Cytochrome b5 n=1 Tax=Jaminaea rosea TaxID=1569628 RepID=A0A316UMW5_9BASI|nr:cytochrome b5 [Jaminaea rosea]PWN26642.1 cytochrome b5 [Jaminaea rosea]